MSVTFKDIADKAGVSYSTVSRVINDHPAVSPDAAEAVRRVMKELNYRPIPPEQRRGPIRGTPRKDLTGTFALLFPDTDERAVRTPLSAALTHGIEDYLYEQRMSLMVTHLRDDQRLPICLEKRQVDGVIIHGGEMAPTMINRLRSFPAIWLFQAGRRIDWADQVMPDNDAIGEMAFDYFRERNTKGVIAVDFKAKHVSFRRRTQAFVQAAADTGTPCKVINTSDNGALLRALKAKAHPDAIFCPGDIGEAVAICNTVREAGFEPMRDIAIIVCANDSAHLRSIHPELPNIDIQPEALGRTAAERLIWRLDNPKEPTQRLLIAPRLNVIEDCAKTQ